jgi:hypothetical protein
MAAIEVSCFSCQASLEFVDRVGFRAECEKCGEDVHVCRNCTHYDPKAYNECRESSADMIREKNRSNYCDYFSPRSGGTSEAQKKLDLLSAAEALFKKKDS